MALFEFKLPDIGEGIATAEIVAWHVMPGDTVEEDASLCDVMTDKATVEMTAPVSGKLVEIGGELGESIAIGSLLAKFETESDRPVEDAEAPHEPPQSDTATVSETHNSSLDFEVSPAIDDCGSSAFVSKIIASPAVRARARSLGVELSHVKALQGDRIRHSDLDTFLVYNGRLGYHASDRRRADEQIKVIGLRRRIAQNMATAKREIPHFTYVEEFDVTKLEELRADLNASRGEKPRLTILPLLICGICKVLPDFPMINARFDADSGVVNRSGAVHLGVATQTPAGLMVPVIRNADQQNIWQLAAEIARLAKAARSGAVRIDELSGSTLTITSLGVLGGISTTPVINHPEVAIVGPNRIVERPVCRDGLFVAAKMMNMSMSCDHRVVDGWDAAQFIRSVKYLIETPALLFQP